MTPSFLTLLKFPSFSLIVFYVFFCIFSFLPLHQRFLHYGYLPALLSCTRHHDPDVRRGAYLDIHSLYTSLPPAVSSPHAFTLQIGEIAFSEKDLSSLYPAIDALSSIIRHSHGYLSHIYLLRSKIGPALLRFLALDLQMPISLTETMRSQVQSPRIDETKKRDSRREVIFLLLHLFRLDRLCLLREYSQAHPLIDPPNIPSSSLDNTVTDESGAALPSHLSEPTQALAEAFRHIQDLPDIFPAAELEFLDPFSRRFHDLFLKLPNSILYNHLVQLDCIPVFRSLGFLTQSISGPTLAFYQILCNEYLLPIIEKEHPNCRE